MQKKSFNLADVKKIPRIAVGFIGVKRKKSGIVHLLEFLYRRNRKISSISNLMKINCNVMPTKLFIECVFSNLKEDHSGLFGIVHKWEKMCSTMLSKVNEIAQLELLKSPKLLYNLRIDGRLDYRTSHQLQ